jgi:AraC family transcriptional regulator
MFDRDLVIHEVISYIHEHIYDPLPLEQLAKYAGYSPYHFTRLFKDRVGISQSHYISSLRLQKAKELLLHTNLNVRDIAIEIGQQSLGTFTTRFTEKVGMAPAEFRNSQHRANHDFVALSKLEDWHPSRITPGRYTTIQGSISAEIPFDGLILIGLFAKPIPEGRPIHGTLLPGLGEFQFTNVEPGNYYLMATSISWRSPTSEFLLPTSTLRTRTRLPIIVDLCSQAPFQQVELRMPSLDDPPILISLPVLMNSFLNQIADRI